MGMRGHLLSWTLGPAFLGGVAGYSGMAVQQMPVQSLAQVLVGFGWMAAFVVGFLLFAGVLVTLTTRLEKGRVAWPEVRLFLKVMAVKMALLFFVFLTFGFGWQLAGSITGGWPKGDWSFTLAGAGVGAGAGLTVGLVLAWANLPERLGLNKSAQSATQGHAQS